MEKQLQTARYKVLASTKDKRLCYAGGRIWTEDASHAINRVEAGFSKLSRIRLAERVLRLTPRTGFALGGTFYYTTHGWLYRVDEKNRKAQPVFQFRPGMNNPLSVCVCQWDRKEAAYWGEYWINANREEASVFAFDGDAVKKMCTLSGVKHIHTVVWDRYRECFWITTGDSDDESRIYKASRTFDRTECVFMGQQKYRTCALIPTEKGLLYATDSPLCPNSLFFSEEQEGRFLEPAAVAPMPGPCLFCQEIRGNYFFSTSVESNPDQPIVKYWLSWKVGPGNVDRKAYVLRVNQDLQVTEVWSEEKDIHNMAFFHFGSFQLSYDASAGALAAYCTALKKYDGQTLFLSVEGEES